MIVTRCDSCDVEISGGGGYTITHPQLPSNRVPNKHFCGWYCIKEYAQRFFGENPVTAIN